VLTRSAKICPHCGYLHPLTGGALIEVCDACGSGLGETLVSLFRLENVVTRRRDRISSDEEERQRQGYELHTAVRFAGHGPVMGTAQLDGERVAELLYGHSATIWRINMGWRRRRSTEPPGFVLDLERGYWQSRKDDPDDEDHKDPMSPRVERVIPYVDDTRNALLVEPQGMPADNIERARVMASLEAALKMAVQVVFQLEDSELATHPLPAMADRRRILVFEAAEGGAGVLRRLVEEPKVFADVARAALELCHFDPVTGDDTGGAPHVEERCEAACYDCLLSYGNQPDHRLVDRFLIRDLLMTWAESAVEVAPGSEPRTLVLQRLKALAGSELERRWLEFLQAGNLRLPTRAQVLIADASSRPDFLYEQDFVAIYVDGPPHDYPERQTRDASQEALLEELGWRVVRFRYDENWSEEVRLRPDVFGEVGV
jgi:very-short-patch-repair endonuclease